MSINTVQDTGDQQFDITSPEIDRELKQLEAAVIQQSSTQIEVEGIHSHEQFTSVCEDIVHLSRQIDASEKKISSWLRLVRNTTCVEGAVSLSFGVGSVTAMILSCGVALAGLLGPGIVRSFRGDVPEIMRCVSLRLRRAQLVNAAITYAQKHDESVVGPIASQRGIALERQPGGTFKMNVLVSSGAEL